MPNGRKIFFQVTIDMGERLNDFSDMNFSLKTNWRWTLIKLKHKSYHLSISASKEEDSTA
jgi:hypothetical protein